MGAPILGNSNKVTGGQKFLSLVGLDERISKLEAKVQELARYSEDDADLIKTLTEKHNKHLSFGHPNNKSQVGKKND
jgi:hypothetical protein